MTDSSSGKILYQNKFITNHEIHQSNVSKIAKGGKTRWKVEKRDVSGFIPCLFSWFCPNIWYSW
ncbi:MAG: hypothetical protein AB4058_01545 [Microcystaceae cyanobacterium]